MFYNGVVPNKTSPVAEKADYMEWMCIKSDTHSYSVNELKSVWSVESDNSDENEDETIDRCFTDIFTELQNRQRYCNGKYPFEIGLKSLSFKTDHSVAKTLYCFLLLSTRLNMNTDRRVDDIDATALFEELSAAVAKSYFGERADSYVFGTGSNAAGNRLEDKINHMAKTIGEDFMFKRQATSTGREKDTNLDVVVYKDFKDNRSGKLIGMGQCKTGSNWDEMIGQLDPTAIFKLHATGSPMADPVKMFFVAEACSQKWHEYAAYGGIFFDRSRIMDYMPANLDEALLSKIEKWTNTSISRS